MAETGTVLSVTTPISLAEPSVTVVKHLVLADKVDKTVVEETTTETTVVVMTVVVVVTTVDVMTVVVVEITAMMASSITPMIGIVQSVRTPTFPSDLHVTSVA